MNWIIPDWKAPKNVKALSSTRLGGCSRGVYEGLNLGMHVGDDPVFVRENRRRLEEESGMPHSPVWLNQTHSAKVVEVNAPTTEILDADGIFTTHPGVVCSAMTADCLPVLLTNSHGTEVAAVHAGWRGLAGGIVENAVNKFSGDVMAWLGPAIGSQAFEVGEDVRQAFMDFDQQAALAFTPLETEGKWLADMERLATQRLNRLGVTMITRSRSCTYQNPGKFYSYRRDGITGRQAAFIWMT